MTLEADIRPSSARTALPFGVSRAYLFLIAAHGATAITLSQVSAFRFDPGMAKILGLLLTILLPWFLLVLRVRRVIILGVVEKSATPIQDLVASLKALALDRERILGGVIKFMLISFFIGASAYLKAMITEIQPFAWDAAFASLDRALHFGIDPYRITLALFGSSLATTALNVVYHAWFFVIYFLTFVACFARPDDRFAKAFLIGLVLTFAIGGNLLALVFSSAGPVYFERLGLGADFEPLMEHLRTLNDVRPVWALGVQEGLWEGHMRQGDLSGISAMPSMHVATTVLMALYASTHARWAAWAKWGFAGLIMIGSVHLGWHYAVDGYFGALIAWAAWRLAVLFAERERA